MGRGSLAGFLRGKAFVEWENQLGWRDRVSKESSVVGLQRCGEGHWPAHLAGCPHMSAVSFLDKECMLTRALKCVQVGARQPQSCRHEGVCHGKETPAHCLPAAHTYGTCSSVRAVIITRIQAHCCPRPGLAGSNPTPTHSSEVLAPCHSCQLGSGEPGTPGHMSTLFRGEALSLCAGRQTQ